MPSPQMRKRRTARAPEHELRIKPIHAPRRAAAKVAPARKSPSAARHFSQRAQAEPLMRAGRSASASEFLLKPKSAVRRRPARADAYPELISEAELRSLQRRESFRQPIELSGPIALEGAPHTERLHAPLATAVPQPSSSAPRRAVRSAPLLTRLLRHLQFLIARLSAWLKSRPAARLTRRGQAALAQLTALKGLVQAEMGDSMDMVAAEVAYGQAYYALMRESQGHYRAHKGKGSEDYRAHIESFLRQMP